MRRDIDFQTYSGSLIAGASVTLSMLDYFALTAGVGLQIAAKGHGRFMPLDVYTVVGDGNGPIGTVALYNPTGGTLAYTIVTASVLFNPTALSNTGNVALTAISVTVPVSGTVNAVATGPAASGAAVSGNPVRVGGSDGANTRDLVATTGGVLRIAPEASNLGGATRLRAISAASTNSTLVSAAARKLYGYTVSNTNAAARFLKLYDKATAPTVGTDTPAATILVPPTSTLHVDIAVGEAFVLGLGYGMTTGNADADVGAVAVGDLHLVLRYQ